MIDPVVAISFETSLDGGDTINLAQNGVRSTIVGLTFASGLRYANLHEGAGNLGGISWIDITRLITFNSVNTDGSSASIITLDANGQITLLDNHRSIVNLTAALSCRPGMVDDIAVIANLAPSGNNPAFDVDLGNPTGFQFQQTGNTLQIPIRANVPFGQLVGFELDASWPDASVLTTDVSVSASVAWSPSTSWTGQITCTLNDPGPNTFLVVGADSTSTASGIVNIGTVTLGVVGSGIVQITTTIRRLIARVGSSDVDTTITTSIAGTGFADITLNGGRRLGEAVPTAAPPLWRPTNHRRRASACSPGTDACSTQVYGDLDGDCRCDVADVLESMRLATRMFNFRQNGGSNPLNAYPCEWIRQQANPSLDYIGGDTNNPQVDVVDFGILNVRSLAKVPLRRSDSNPVRQR